MNQLTDSGIIMRRTDYGEADRILTFITPTYGKVRAIAKGVRKQKSKMAGGIELFSISELHFIKGKGDLDTLTSTRLKKNFSNIVKNLDRTDVGYECLKTIMRSTEDNCEPEYFYLVEDVFTALDDVNIPFEVARAWFYVRLIALAGHQPELSTDTSGEKFAQEKSYVYDFEAGGFRQAGGGGVSSGVIKLLRLLVQHQPQSLAKVQGIEAVMPQTRQLLKQMVDYYVQPLRSSGT